MFYGNMLRPMYKRINFSLICVLDSWLALMYVHQVHAELVHAIKDAEEALLHLKRARLLQEADLFLQGPKSPLADVKVESLDPSEVEAEPFEHQSYSVGSKCRFRHSDGRWYNGLIIGLEGTHSAKLSFLIPTTESMLVRAYITFSFLLLLSLA